MKTKAIFLIIISILLGTFLGNLFFSEYNNTSYAFSEKQKIYFVQLGVYSDNASLKEVYPFYDDYLTILEDDGYHLYAAITKNEEIAKKVQACFAKEGKNTYIKEKMETNLRFLNVLSEYDKIKMIVSSDKDLMDIEKIVISSYKEMVLER